MCNSNNSYTCFYFNSLSSTTVVEHCMVRLWCHLRRRQT